VNSFTIVTLFPDLIEAFAETGIVRRARDRGHVVVDTIDPRSFTVAGRGRVDDAPYGGGPGMVMMVPPLRAAIDAARKLHPQGTTVAYLSPQGRRIDQELIERFTSIRHLVLVAGRYEGIDERVIERDIDVELSLGDFVMSGGEIAAMAVVDAVEYPQYTRPDDVNGQRVPAVLLSGNHALIDRWRRKQAIGRTWLKRPDLAAGLVLSAPDKQLLKEFQAELRAADGEFQDGD